MRVEMFVGSDRKESFVCCCFHNRSISLKIINSFSLLETASNPSSLVLLNITVDIPLLFKSPFTTQYMLMIKATTRTQIPLATRNSYSTLIASRHASASSDFKAFFKEGMSEVDAFAFLRAARTKPRLACFSG